MRWRRVALGTVALLALLVGTVLPASVSAAPSATPSNVTFSSPTEGQKVILPELSIDGPALWTFPTGTTRAIIAWTGTDHRLNYMTSSDGLHFTNKHTLNETSLWRPAVTVALGRGAGTMALAWTGTDRAHTLNVMYIDMYNWQQTAKQTFWGETSFTAPAVASYGGEPQDTIALAWAGNDAGHTVNVMRLARVTHQVTGKSTYWGWSSISRPDLNWVRGQGQMLLSFTGPNQRMYFATSSDVTKFTMPATSPIAEYSAWAPSMMGLSESNMPDHWLAWTGIDGAHSVNVRYTQSFPSWPLNNYTKAILNERAISGPELGYVGNVGQVLVSWTGVDAAHHLNVAVVGTRTISTGYLVKVFFSRHPESDNNPLAVFPVNRTSPTSGVATYAVQQLLAGPTAAEKQANYFTEFVGNVSGTSTCGGADFTITLDKRGTTPEPGTATLQFCRTVSIPGELAGARMAAELNATLTQFPTITKAVVLTKDGNCFNDLSGQNLCLKG